MHCVVFVLMCRLPGPDAESLKFAAEKGINLEHSWAANIEDDRPSVSVYNDDGDEEEVSATPLAMAFMFGNYEAAEALICHGARMPKLGTSKGPARRFLLMKLFEKNEKFSSILDTITESGEENAQLVKAFLATCTDCEEVEESDDEENDGVQVSE
jgi:hypothetical protein